MQPSPPNAWIDFPPCRALQGSRDQARDARRGMRAGLAPDPTTLFESRLRAAGLRLNEH
jgi:hypothetical protein